MIFLLGKSRPKFLLIEPARNFQFPCSYKNSKTAYSDELDMNGRLIEFFYHPEDSIPDLKPEYSYLK